MLLKFRFKNYSCFRGWQEIDFLNLSTSLDQLKPAVVSCILGENKSGKSSIVKLFQLTIDYLKHFLNYEKTIDFNLNKKQSISAKSNPFVFINSINQKTSSIELPYSQQVKLDDDLDSEMNSDLETNDSVKENNEYEIYNTYVQLYFSNSTDVFKYELCFNHMYCEFEKLAIANNNGDNDLDFKYIYKKENLTYDVINQEETCVYSEELDLDYLKINKEPTFVHINKKNSLVSYIKSISQSKTVSDFVNIYSNILFVDEYSGQGIYKTYNIDKEYLKKNKNRFIYNLNNMGFNIVDFSINSINVNTFYLMVGKKDNNGTIMYINSEYESETFNCLLNLLYYVFQALDNRQILVMDNLHKSLNYDIVAYIIDLFNKQEDIDGKQKAQFIFTINNHYENDLIGICQATSRLDFNWIESKIKRVI